MESELNEKHNTDSDNRACYARDGCKVFRADKSVRGGMENDLQLRFFMSAWEKAKANESVKLLRPATTLRISSQATRVIEGIEV